MPKSNQESSVGLITAPPDPDPWDADDDEMSPYAPVRILLESRYLLIVTLLLGGLIAGATANYDSRTYTADAAFMPQGSPLPPTGGAAAVAGQLGLTVPGSTMEQSPRFYADLLVSRRILTNILAHTFQIRAAGESEGPSRRGTLPELFGIEGASEAETVHWTRVELRSAIEASVDEGIVRLSVVTPWPDLSASIAGRLIQLVEEFNVATRRSSAAAESRFLEARVAETQARLRNAEERVRQFLESNRQFQNSPGLVFEYERLGREVTMQEQILITLSQAYASALSSAVRDTPLITVVEPPEEPAFPNSRGIVRRTLFGLLIGLGLGVLVALAREMVRKARANEDEEYLKLRAAWRDTIGDFGLARKK